MAIVATPAVAPSLYHIGLLVSCDDIVDLRTDGDRTESVPEREQHSGAESD